MTEPVDLTGIKNALHVWVVASSGLEAKRVFFAGQNIVRPDPNAFIAMRIAGIDTVGSDWNEDEANPDHDEDTDEDDIIIYSRGHRQFTLTIQAFPVDKASDANEAHAILLRVVAHAARPSVWQKLTDAGIGLFNLGPIVPIDGVRNSTRFDPRAILTLTFDAVSEVTDFVQEIRQVSAEVETTNPARTFTFTTDTSDS